MNRPIRTNAPLTEALKGDVAGDLRLPGAAPVVAAPRCDDPSAASRTELEQEPWERLERAVDEGDALDRALGLTDEDLEHSALCAALPRDVAPVEPLFARVAELLSAALRADADTRVAVPGEAPTTRPFRSPESLWLQLVRTEQVALETSAKPEGSANASLMRALFEHGYDPIPLAKRARVVAAAVNQAVAEKAARRKQGLVRHGRARVPLTGAYARFWSDTVPALDDGALYAILEALAFTAMEIHIMGAREIRNREALFRILRRVPDVLPDFGGLSTTVPEPISFSPCEFEMALAEHGRLFDECHDALVATICGKAIEEPYDFIDAMAGHIHCSSHPGHRDEVGYSLRSEVAYNYRRYHGVYRKLFLTPRYLHSYLVIRTDAAVSLRTVKVEPGPGGVRLVPDPSTLIVEPTRQAHVLERDHVRTISVTPGIRRRVDVRALWPLPDEFEILDRLLALYEPLIRERFASELPRDHGDDPGRVFVSVLSSWFFGDSVQVLTRAEHPASTTEFPTIAAELGRASPAGWVPVLVEDRDVGGLRWLRVCREAAEPAPSPRNEKRVQDPSQEQER